MPRVTPAVPRVPVVVLMVCLHDQLTLEEQGLHRRPPPTVQSVVSCSAGADGVSGWAEDSQRLLGQRGAGEAEPWI